MRGLKQGVGSVTAEQRRNGNGGGQGRRVERGGRERQGGGGGLAACLDSHGCTAATRLVPASKSAFRGAASLASKRRYLKSTPNASTTCEGGWWRVSPTSLHEALPDHYVRLDC